MSSASTRSIVVIALNNAMSLLKNKATYTFMLTRIKAFELNVLSSAAVWGSTDACGTSVISFTLYFRGTPEVMVPVVFLIHV